MSFKRFMLCLATLSVYGYTVMIGCGPYTQLLDPNKKPPDPAPEIITPIKDDALPQLRREYYAERLARDRYYRYTAWDRYTGYGYRPYESERIIYVDTRTVPQHTQVAPVTALNQSDHPNHTTQIEQQKYGKNVLVQELEKHLHLLKGRKVMEATQEDDVSLIKGFYFVNHT